MVQSVFKLLHIYMAVSNSVSVGYTIYDFYHNVTMHNFTQSVIQKLNKLVLIQGIINL